jgi:hypothetical protein
VCVGTQGDGRGDLITALTRPFADVCRLGTQQKYVDRKDSRGVEEKVRA